MDDEVREECQGGPAAPAQHRFRLAKKPGGVARNHRPRQTLIQGGRPANPTHRIINNDYLYQDNLSIKSRKKGAVSERRFQESKYSCLIIWRRIIENLNQKLG